MASFDVTDLVPQSAPPLGEVEVRTRFDGHWARGFEIVAVSRDSCLVRRRSDGSVLPTPFRADDVRARGPR